MTWRKTRLKFLASQPIQNGLGEAGVHDNPDWPRYIRTTDISGPRELRDDVFASLPPDLAQKATLRPGDLLMTAAGATIGKSLLYLDEAPACYAGYLVRFRPLPTVDPQFVAYWTESVSYWDQIRAGRVVSTIENFSASKYRNLCLSLPPLPVQQGIVNYLDGETARIDALVAAKRRMIELLELRRQAMIDRAVLASGPRIRVKNLVSRITSGPRGWSQYIADDGVMFLRIANVAANSVELDMSAVTYVQAPDNAERRRTAVLEGDVLVSITAEIGSIGVAGAEHVGAAVSQHIALLTPKRCSGEWLAYALSTSDAKAQQEAARYGGTKVQLSLDDVTNISVPVAPIDRQRKILSDLTRGIRTLNSIQHILGEQLQLLREHRQALITAAVTGQLEVPETA